MNYGLKLKELREEFDISQYKLANELGIKRSSYNQFEQQYDIIPIKRLNQLAVFYNVSIDYILDLTDRRTYNHLRDDISLDISSKRLKDWRKSNKITQEKLASVLKSSRHVIVCYEHGSNFIATPFLYTICKKYNISADYLLGKIDEPIKINLDN